MDTHAERAMTNKEMAAVLFNIATLLRQGGSANLFRIAAYERCARALMGYPAQVGDVLRVSEKVPFRRVWHIGKKLQAKMAEMAADGDLEQYRQMLDELPPHLAALMSGVPGVGLKRAERIHAALGITTAEELVRAARNGRLSSVPGFGPKRVGEIAAVELPGDEAGVTLRSVARAAQASLFDLPTTA